jgi:lipid-A-disaccharide synthase
VGHPLAQLIPLQNSTAEARRQLGLAEHRRTIALLPGSRTGEVSRLSGPMIEAAAQLSREFPDLQFVAAIANANVGGSSALNHGTSPDIRI